MISTSLIHFWKSRGLGNSSLQGPCFSRALAFVQAFSTHHITWFHFTPRTHRDSHHHALKSFGLHAYSDMLVLRFLIEVSNPTSGITTCLLPKETKNRNSNYKKQVLFKDTILVTSNPVALGKRRNNSGTMKHVSFLCWRLERPLYQHSFQGLSGFQRGPVHCICVVCRPAAEQRHQPELG